MASLSVDDAIKALGGSPPPAPQAAQAPAATTTEVQAAPPVEPSAPLVPAGTTEQLDTGITLTRTTPTQSRREEAPRAPVSIRPPSGLDDFTRISQALEWVESKYADDITSPKGAKGPRQIMPDTAKTYGAKGDEWQKGDANRVLGDKILLDIYSRRGNWADTLGEYVAGGSDFDKWVEAGRPDNKLGKDITKYQEAVFNQAHLAGVGQDKTGAKRQLTVEDAMSSLQGMQSPKGKDLTEADLADLAVMAGGPLGFVDTSRFIPSDDDSSDVAGFERGVIALQHSMLQGVRNAITGPIQFGLEMVSPVQAKKFTDMINSMDEPYRTSHEQHPYLSTVGNVIGTAGAFMAGGGLISAGARALTPTSVMPWLAEKAPALVKATTSGGPGLTTAGKYAASVPTGAAIGATSYNPSGDPSARIWEAALGSVLGPLGVAVGQGVGWGIRKAADNNELQRVLGTVKDAVGKLSPELIGLKDTAVSRLSRLEAEDQARFRLRDEAGRAITGFDAQRLGETLREAAQDTKAASQVRSIAQRARDEMGVTAEDARRAAAEVAQKQYDDAVRDLTAQQDAFAEKMIGVSKGQKANPSLLSQVKRDLAANQYPGYPTLPAAPEAYAPKPIEAEAYAKGMQYLTTEWRRAAGNPTKRGQIQSLIQKTAEEAKTQASELGLSAEDFLRLAMSANKFHREQLGPIRDSFRQAFGKEFTNAATVKGTGAVGSGVSPHEFYGWVVKTLEKGDPQEIRGLRHVLGGNDNAQKMLETTVLHRMLTQAQKGTGEGEFDTGKLAKYIADNRDTLRQVLSRERFDELNGFAKISQRVADQNVAQRAAHHGGRFFGWSPFLAIVGMEHALRGHPIEGGMMVASGVMAHTLFNAFQNLRQMPSLSGLVRRAGAMKPDSPELDNVIRQLEARYARQYLVGSRVGGEKTFGGQAQPQ